MSKKKEIKNRKNKSLKFLAIGAIGTIVSVFGLCASAFLFVETAIIPLTITFIATGMASIGLFTGNLVKYISDSYTSSRTRNKSLSNLEKISNEKSNEMLNLSDEQKIKIVKKYANANLKHSKIAGNSATGKLHSISGMQKEKQTQAFNEIENLEILKQISTSERKRKKFDKKIEKKKKVLSKLSTKTVPQRWTKSYDNFIEGVSIYDRRTEIGCLSQSTSEKFKKLAQNIESTKEIGGSVIITFKQNNKIQKTYARISDVSKLSQVKNLMLNDVLEMCEKKSNTELQSLFPFKLEAYTIDKKSTKMLKPETTMISTLEELKALTGKNVNNELHK